MKKDKHITINVNDNDYNKLNNLAALNDRNVTNYCYLIIIKHLKDKEGLKNE